MSSGTNRLIYRVADSRRGNRVLPSLRGYEDAAAFEDYAKIACILAEFRLKRSSEEQRENSARKLRRSIQGLPAALANSRSGFANGWGRNHLNVRIVDITELHTSRTLNGLTGVCRLCKRNVGFIRSSSIVTSFGRTHSWGSSAVRSE